MMTLNRRDVLLGATALIAASPYSESAATRILVCAPAGGSTDTLARTLAQKNWGQISISLVHSGLVNLRRAVPLRNRNLTWIFRIFKDVIAGQVELMFAAVGNAQAHVKAGKLKALGVPVPNAWLRSLMCQRLPRCCRAMSQARDWVCLARPV